MSTQLKTYLTPQEYLAIEREAEFKSEYFRGEMFAMSDASRKHDIIAGNIVEEFCQQLKRRSRSLYINDIRVKSSTGLYAYPDVAAVFNGQPEFEDAHHETLLNPTLLVEVTSESTADYDRRRKFAHYRGIESLTEYLLVDEDKCRVEHFGKQSDRQWLQTVVQSLDADVELVNIQCALRLREIYHRVF